MTEDWGNKIDKATSAEELRERQSSPVILVFQPDSFLVAESPDELRAWEEMATSRFNIPARVVESIVQRVDAGSCSESGAINDCDID